MVPPPLYIKRWNLNLFFPPDKFGKLFFSLLLISFIIQGMLFSLSPFPFLPSKYFSFFFHDMLVHYPFLFTVISFKPKLTILSYSFLSTYILCFQHEFTTFLSLEFLDFDSFLFFFSAQEDGNCLRQLYD